MNIICNSNAALPSGTAQQNSPHVAAQERSAMASAGLMAHGTEPALSASDVRELIRIRRVLDLCRFPGGRDGRA